MRNIKFRFWDARSDEWCDSENWLPSYTRFDVNKTFELALKDGIVVQQYTGLKDKNGIEIYEGDIVEYTQHMFNTKKTRVEQKEIKYEKYSTGFNVYETAAGQSDHKVIGNIFEGVDK